MVNGVGHGVVGGLKKSRNNVGLSKESWEYRSKKFVNVSYYTFLDLAGLAINGQILNMISYGIA